MGLTTLGIVHTLISLVALGAGIAALVRYRHLGWATTVGKIYIATTALTCLTGFGIFQHGGFGKPHALGIITLVVLAVAFAAERSALFGRFSRYVATAGYSMTFLFHWIPGITETTTRLPVGKPWVSSPEAPELQLAAGVLFVAYLAGAAWQVSQLRGQPVAAAPLGDEDALPR